MRQSGFPADVSNYNYDLGEHNQNNSKGHTDTKSLDPHLLSTSTFALDCTYSSICKRAHKTLATFLLQNKVFLQAWHNRDSFPHNGYMFPQATFSAFNRSFSASLAQQDIFSSLRFVFLQAHPFSNHVGE